MKLLAQLQETLGEQYRIERELGGGGMSRVFLAHESALGRTVVIKVVAPGLVEGLSADRFTREVRVAARLQQANIVPLLSAGNADGVPYYTMPFVDGLSLRERLFGGPPLSQSEATGVLRDVAKALAYAHAQAVVHRDIKPENVLLSGGTAMVTDFGIAKALTASRAHDGSDGFATASGTLTSAGSSLGTPAYMAPEQAVGSIVDLRADLYAWGVMAYELLTGAHPFAGRTTAQQLIAAHIAETPAPITTRQPAIPPAIASVVMRCMAKDPEQRPSSAAELLAALDGVTAPTAPVAPAPTRGVPEGVRLVTVLGALASLLIVGVGTWYLTRNRTSREGASQAAPLAAEKSLAVIPFESAGGDTANAYFAEGIADELTTALSRVPGLRLAGRASASRFRGQGASAPEVGKALNVATVLAGSLRRSGDRVRVTAELTSAADGSVLWQDTFERRVEDVFAVQDEIASAIASALQVRLGNSSASGVSAMGTANFEAYDLYLRGSQLYRNRRGAELGEAEKVLEAAIAKDPQFARAYATLASTLLVQPYYLDVRMGKVLPRALAAAERAVALAPELPEALAALGHVHTEGFEWKLAEAELRRAYTLAPANSEIGFRLGFMYITSGRAGLAVPVLEEVKRIDPFYSMPSMYLAWSMAMSGRGAEAIPEARRALALDPSNEALNNVYANTLLAAGATNEAMVHARRLANVTMNPRRLGFYAAVIGEGGGDVSDIARRLDALPPDAWGVNAARTYLALSVGDTARALDYMEKAAASDGDLLLAQALNATLFSQLSASPRFAKVLQRYNLDALTIGSSQAARPR